ncbi:MAG: DNA-binding protein WhiA, partial [Actinomycetota bacterium]
MGRSSSEVKEELSRIKASRRCCRLAELSALLHMDGTYAIRGQKGHVLVTESSTPGTARKIYTLAHDLFEVETSLVKVGRSSPCRGNVYRVEIQDQPGFKQMLHELGVLDSSLAPESGLPRRLVAKECCAASAMRGAFLGGGYVSEPYGPADLEISFSSREACLAFRELFERRGLVPGMRRRRNQWVLYMKMRNRVSEFLAITGAHAAHLEWESHSIISGTKNQVNRLVNCDAANARRLAQASLRQRELVSSLKDAGMLRKAPPELAALAEARLLHPQASLAELGRALEPPVS